ncbi:hypothetical protein F7725_015153 [Dissostichus mawsoni]|uniref:Integrin alpha-2 domain-containing protein n=1 Tax=Dissostichus mawsoni TaxID=36200 RepID=A0A7J5YGN7_DISMA|nr:hypothetical protein F7725_015153 [Dissostichus mawsoni]
MLGAVGAYDWNGTVVMHTAAGTIVPGKNDFYDPETEAGYEGLAGYLGYDVQSASTPDGVLYISGAPRYNHTGRVIGSYFGSVLQTVDVDGDSFTDLLLVGAPMFMGTERNEQGQVYVYKINQENQFEHQFTLKPVNQSCCTAHSEGCTNQNEPCGTRFGTAIAAVSDMNLDGFNDVAIGAPFENDHRGAVYIYHGEKTSLKEKYVQHIPAGGDGVKVKFFGSPSMEDVAELRGNMTFDPVKINLQQAQHQCEHGGRKSVCVKTEVCFVYIIKSDQQAEHPAAGIRYTLTLDALRAKARASFIGSDEKSDRRVARSFNISHRERKCAQETFMMSANPLMVSLEFGLSDEDQGPVLDENLPRSINKTIMFPMSGVYPDKEGESDVGIRLQHIPLVDCGSDEKMMIRTNKDKIDVNINVRNSKDNARPMDEHVVKINPKVVYPNPKKETLSVFLLRCENQCASFRCSLPENTSSQVNVTFRVWKPTFITGEFTSLYMLVNATLKITNTDLFELSDSTRSTKIQVSKESSGGIPIWIIIISILIGLLILALVIFALWKFSAPLDGLLQEKIQRLLEGGHDGLRTPSSSVSADFRTGSRTDGGNAKGPTHTSELRHHDDLEKTNKPASNNICKYFPVMLQVHTQRGLL